MPTRTQEVWNCVRGCKKVSAGCQNCYAEKMACRLSGPGRPYEGLVRDGRWTGRARFVPEKLELPLRWRKPRRVFVASMGDVFHEDISDEQIAEIFGVMAVCSAAPDWAAQTDFDGAFHGSKGGPHVFQLLTKRPARMQRFIMRCRKLVASAAHRHAYDRRDSGWLSDHIEDGSLWPLHNVWLGVTAENQEMADERIPLLLETPAAVRFVSVEPMLGDVDCSDNFARYREIGDQVLPCPDWLICGCEKIGNRPGRPMELDWARSLRDQCQAAGVAFFLKQMEANGRVVECPELDGRQWMEYPE